MDTTTGNTKKGPFTKQTNQPEADNKSVNWVMKKKTSKYLKRDLLKNEK